VIKAGWVFLFGFFVMMGRLDKNPINSSFILKNLSLATTKKNHFYFYGIGENTSFS